MKQYCEIISLYHDFLIKKVKTLFTLNEINFKMYVNGKKTINANQMQR